MPTEAPYRIVEIDNDYRAYVKSFTKYFKSREEADKWCRDNSWSAFHYFVEGKDKYAD